MIRRVSHKKIDDFFAYYPLMKYKKREIVMRSDDARSTIYYINRGFVRAYRISEEGGELTLLILKNGEFYPLTYGLNNMPTIYYLEAITALEVYKAPQVEFLTFLSSNPDVFFDLSTQVMDRFDGMLARMEYMVWSKAHTKVAATLLICARRFGQVKNNTLLITVPLTHQDIATMVGLTRETTSVEMKKLEKKGILSKRGRFLFIENVKQLEKESLLNCQEELLQNNFL